MIDISNIELTDLWTKEHGVNTNFQDDDMEIFVTFNRYSKPFIMVNIYPQQSRTFNFSNKGLLSAKKFIKHIRLEVMN